MKSTIDKFIGKIANIATVVMFIEWIVDKF